MIYLTIIAVALVVALVWREHLVQAERDSWARERVSLLNRIKPETAQPLVDDDDGEEMPQPPASSEEWQDRYGVGA